MHVGRVEVRLCPNHETEIVFRKVFSPTSDEDLDAAAKVVAEKLQDPRWRKKLRMRLVGALDFLQAMGGELRETAHSRSAEVQRLLCALDRIEGKK